MSFKIKQKQKKAIEKAYSNYIYSIAKQGKLGYEKIEDIEDMETTFYNTIIKEFYNFKSLEDVDDLETTEYDKKLKDILDYATENSIDWVIDYRINEDHKKIYENENKVKLKKSIETFVDLLQENYGNNN